MTSPVNWLERCKVGRDNNLVGRVGSPRTAVPAVAVPITRRTVGVLVDIAPAGVRQKSGKRWSHGVGNGTVHVSGSWVPKTINTYIRKGLSFWRTSVVHYTDTMPFGWWHLVVDIEAFAETMYGPGEHDGERLELARRIVRFHFAACGEYASRVGYRSDIP